MDIGSVGNMSSILNQAKTGDAVGIAVLKKAIDMQAQSASQLIQALPQPAAAGTTQTLGNGVNTFA